jgi:hypothetical protein
VSFIPGWRRCRRYTIGGRVGVFEEYAAGLAVEDHERLYLRPYSGHVAGRDDPPPTESLDRA